MLCYYTVLKTQHLTQNILIEMLEGWLRNSKNKMAGLNIVPVFPFEYRVDKKVLKIQVFAKRYFAIAFSTQDNHKKIRFIVELIFDQIEEQIHLRFSKETANDSGYISAVSIPVLFRNLLTSSYIKKESDFSISQVQVIDDIHKIKEKNFHIPVVYLRTKFVDAHYLVRRILGLAYVCIAPDQKEEGCIEIIDGKNSRFYQWNKKKPCGYQINEINEILRNYMIKKYQDDMLSYELLYQNQIFYQQNQAFNDIKAYQQEFEEEIKRQQQEIEELKEIYELMLTEKKQVQSKKQKLCQIKQDQGDPVLYIDHLDKVVKYRRILIQYIQRKIQELETSGEIYRRLDIIKSIFQKNEDNI